GRARRPRCSHGSDRGLLRRSRPRRAPPCKRCALGRRLRTGARLRAARGDPGRSCALTRPRVLFVGRTRYRLPLPDSLARKWDALSERMDVRVLASGAGRDPRFHLIVPRHLDGPRFYASLPFEIARELREFRPDVIVAESPYEAVAAELARRRQKSPVKLVVEVHGDWHTSTRLYGSRVRSTIAP